MVRTKAWAAAVLGAAFLAGGGAGQAPGAGAQEGGAPVVTTGFLRPEAHLPLIARVSGLAVEVRYVEGDRVEAGEPVVLLDDSDAKFVVDLAKCDLETAELTLAKIRSYPRIEDLERAKAFYAEGQAGLELAERTLRADMELFQGGILSELSRRRSERSLEAARAVAEARRLDLLIIEKGSRPEDVRLAEVEVERKKVALAQAERAAERTRLAGSRGGAALVSRVWVEEGQWVDTGRTVAELVYMDRLRVELDLPGETVAALPRGTKAVLRSPRHPGEELSGSVVRVSPVIDAASGTIRVVVEAENPDHRFLPGEEAEVEIRP